MYLKHWLSFYSNVLSPLVSRRAINKLTKAKDSFRKHKITEHLEAGPQSKIHNFSIVENLVIN